MNKAKNIGEWILALTVSIVIATPFVYLNTKVSAHAKHTDHVHHQPSPPSEQMPPPPSQPAPKPPLKDCELEDCAPKQPEAAQTVTPPTPAPVTTTVQTPVQAQELPLENVDWGK